MSELQSRNKIRVGVLRGGPSDEYDVSLKSGGNILRNLPVQYVPIDIFISKDGTWHVGGMEKTPDKILPHVDVVWNALRGYFGEDGKVQKILERFHVPFTGSPSFGSAMGMNKNISKALFQYHGLKTPTYTVVHPEHNTQARLVELFQTIHQPSVVKPISGGSSQGVTVAYNFDAFKSGIEGALKRGSSAIVEEYIPGIEVTCGVLESHDGRGVVALAPIIQSRNSTPLSSAQLTDAEQAIIQDIAKAVHTHFGLRHYSAVDVIMHKTRGPHLLEVNTSPSMEEKAQFPKSLRTSNISMEDFIDRVITRALRDKNLV